MDIGRIWALVEYDFTMIKKDKHRWSQMIYFPLATLLAWGFFSIYAASFAFQAAFIILIIQIFWQFSFLSQSTVSTQVMEDIWSRSLRELLSTPITVSEFLVARSITSTARSLFSLFIMFIVADLFFHANFFQNFLTMFPLAIYALVASIGFGIIVISVILRFGQGLNFLAWSVTTGIMFLSAPFFPLSILPQALQYVAYFIPYTWIFQAVKEFVAAGSISFTTSMLAFASSAIYFVASFPLFFYTFEKARERGRLIRLWAG